MKNKVLETAFCSSMTKDLSKEQRDKIYDVASSIFRLNRCRVGKNWFNNDMANSTAEKLVEIQEELGYNRQRFAYTMLAVYPSLADDFTVDKLMDFNRNLKHRYQTNKENKCRAKVNQIMKPQVKDEISFDIFVEKFGDMSVMDLLEYMFSIKVNEDDLMTFKNAKENIGKMAKFKAELGLSDEDFVKLAAMVGKNDK